VEGVAVLKRKVSGVAAEKDAEVVAEEVK
jgi:hypothetical protein